MAVIVAEDSIQKNRGFSPTTASTIGLYENRVFFHKVQEKPYIYTIDKERQVLDLVVNLTLCK